MIVSFRSVDNSFPSRTIFINAVLSQISAHFTKYLQCLVKLLHLKIIQENVCTITDTITRSIMNNYGMALYLRQVGEFLRVLRFPPPIKLTAMI
jgi:hypothetical protein